jgi:hypothetical protein
VPYLQPKIVMCPPPTVPETGQLPGFCLSAQLAVAIVPWHNFNLVGLSATDLEFIWPSPGKNLRRRVPGVFPIEGAR